MGLRVNSHCCRCSSAGLRQISILVGVLSFVEGDLFDGGLSVYGLLDLHGHSNTTLDQHRAFPSPLCRPNLRYRDVTPTRKKFWSDIRVALAIPCPAWQEEAGSGRGSGDLYQRKQSSPVELECQTTSAAWLTVRHGSLRQKTDLEEVARR